ncbi:hypothetical protein DFP93_101297 [Aneurinibacillus soli]|uniref:Uncharacterized protein n=1 Tax=Aneurinibacillus soli TaxID=1500254 RepID=A0A0U5BBE0_9BACL|nr:hypothetical protein [Aneurinibacillus soli]PYE64271.1 hypothetical protein DFP93_101297 [Aneurinibacillus soli]BAU28220.1 hypothetical protein CB4_02394 [Aneurinibacillus soli]
MKPLFDIDGRKYRKVGFVNRLIRGQRYSTVYDLFMGSGSILLNMACKAGVYAGVDSDHLLAELYRYMLVCSPFFTTELAHERAVEMRTSHYAEYIASSLKDRRLVKICMRDQSVAEKFILSVVLLLQGRQKKRLIFMEEELLRIVQWLNELVRKLQSRKYAFLVSDLEDFAGCVAETENDLLILDPPCILTGDSESYTSTHEFILYDMLAATKNDFILFGHLERDGVANDKLRYFVRYFGLKSIHVPVEGPSDGRSVEVMVTNI